MGWHQGFEAQLLDLGFHQRSGVLVHHCVEMIHKQAKIRLIREAFFFRLNPQARLIV